MAVNDTSTIAPVLIVGGGPTGIMLAAELSRRGIPLRIVDRKEAPTNSSRAFTVHARTLEVFEMVGLAEAFLQSGLVSHGFCFNFKGMNARPVLDFRTLRSRYPFILVYSQAETERLLRVHLSETHGIEIEWNSEISALEVAEDGSVSATVTNRATGATEPLAPSFVIGCDGVHSFVRKSMDLPFEGENYQGMIMQMMDAPVSDYDPDPEWIQYYMEDSNFLLTTPLPGGNYRILISDMGDIARAETSQIEAYQKVVDGHGLGFRIGEPEWATQWVIWKRLANIYRKGKVFLCGDSAHVHSPSGGQGMNSCIQDAWNLGWKLAMVLRGEARADLLDTYELERKPIARQVIDGTDAMHDIIMAHGRGMTERMALTETPDWQVRVTELVAGVSYTYRDFIAPVPGLTPLEGGAEAGDRAPDVDLAGGRTLYEAFRHTGFTLLVLPGRDDDGGRGEATRIASGVAELFGEAVSVWIADAADADALTAAYGGPGRLYLIRPDAYIAFRSRLDEGDALIAYLDTVLVPISQYA